LFAFTFFSCPIAQGQTIGLSVSEKRSILRAQKAKTHSWILTPLFDLDREKMKKYWEEK
jgi:hypothetical protein